MTGGTGSAAKSSRAGRNLPAATAVGLSLLAIVIFTLGWWHWGFMLLAASAIGLGVVELHRALGRLDMHSAVIPIVIGTVAILLGAYYAGLHSHNPTDALTVVLGGLLLTSVAAIMWRVPKGSDGFVRDVSASMFTIVYLTMFSSPVALLLADDHGSARIITFMLAVIGADTGGYLVGVLFGKHPMAPKISPKKTWEGFAGSMTFAMGVGAGCAVWLLKAPWWTGVLLGAAMAVTAVTGDLVESMIKRDVGIKDMSNFLPGHGGIMDRLDSLVLAAPVAWVIITLVVPESPM